MELTALGIVVWELCIGLNAWLLTSLQNRSKYRAFPYLSAYLLYRFVRTLVIFPLFYVGNMNLYSRLYWVTDPVLLFLGIAAMADLFKGKRNYFFILGAAICLLQAVLVGHKSNAAIKVEAFTWIFGACCALLLLLLEAMKRITEEFAALRHEINSPSPVGFIIAGRYMREAYLAARDRYDSKPSPPRPQTRMNLLPLGWFVLSFFPAISGRLHILEHGGWLRMVPVFSLGAAYSLWIVWARRLELQPRSPELLR